MCTWAPLNRFLIKLSQSWDSGVRLLENAKITLSTDYIQKWQRHPNAWRRSLFYINKPFLSQGKVLARIRKKMSQPEMVDKLESENLKIVPFLVAIQLARILLCNGLAKALWSRVIYNWFFKYNFFRWWIFRKKGVNHAFLCRVFVAIVRHFVRFGFPFFVLRYSLVFCLLLMFFSVELLRLFR